jgi:hypothetical protein
MQAAMCKHYPVLHAACTLHGNHIKPGLCWQRRQLVPATHHAVNPVEVSSRLFSVSFGPALLPIELTGYCWQAYYVRPPIWTNRAPLRIYLT